MKQAAPVNYANAKFKPFTIEELINLECVGWKYLESYLWQNSSPFMAIVVLRPTNNAGNGFDMIAIGSKEAMTIANDVSPMAKYYLNLEND